MCDDSAVATKEAAGAPEKEIEVTSEMIEAGLEEIYRFTISEPTDDEMREAVRAVYVVMVRKNKLYL